VSPEEMQKRMTKKEMGLNLAPLRLGGEMGLKNKTCTWREKT